MKYITSLQLDDTKSANSDDAKEVFVWRYVCEWVSEGCWCWVGDRGRESREGLGTLYFFLAYYSILHFNPLFPYYHPIILFISTLIKRTATRQSNLPFSHWTSNSF